MYSFQRSPGSALAFPDGLKIGIYQEIVPMGLDPEVISHENTGKFTPIEVLTKLKITS